MKLNYKRIFFVGAAFFLINIFWQTYDTIVPKILIDKFGMSQFWSGAIMAIDNILALFMLPLFGIISDRHKGKRGRRTPFIVVGTLVAAISIFGLSFVDGVQLSKINEISAVADPESSGYTEALEILYEADPTITLEGGKRESLRNVVSREDFVFPAEENDEHYELVVAARQGYAAEVTSENSWTLLAFMGVLFVGLISMATFRSPAVALMPDVTPKPLRSKANAIINLMGAAGVMVMLVAGIILGTGNTKNALMNFTPIFVVASVIMLISLFIFMLKVDEPRFVKEMQEQSKAYGIDEEKDEAQENLKEKRRLSRGEFRSLIFLLASVVFWFMGYNAVITKYSVYALNVLQLDYNLTLLIANAAAIISYIPVGIIASKIGRKKTILIGIVFLAASFIGASFMRAGSNIWIANLLFAMAGIGWATISVNSYPMVVEMSAGSDVGKYTGYYYTASMAAQTVTPMLSGLLLDKISMNTLFPYASIFVVLAFLTMLFVKHGDNIPSKLSSKLEAFDND